MSKKPSLAARLDTIQPSATLAIAQRASDLKARGVDVISFGVGEPDFDTPAHIRDAAGRALSGDVAHYTAVRGTLALRQAICAESARRRGGVTHAPDEVVVSVGAKHSLFNLALVLFDAGDQVIIPAPYWVSYPEQVRLVDAHPVIVPTREEDGFALAPDALERAITDKTKAVILCTPSNPTGSAYTKERLAALAEVFEKHPNVWVIVDEIYGELVYDGFEQRSLLEIAPHLRDRLIVVDGVSKTYAMTGWRIGWILAPKAVASACDKIQGQSTTNPSAIAQVASVAALTGPREPIEAMRRAFEVRRGLMVNGLRGVPGISCRMPEGAFYAFPNVKGLLGKKTPAGQTLETDIDICNFFIDEARIAAVPGTPFGAPGYIRLSYATANELIEEGVRRIGAAVAKLS